MPKIILPQKNNNWNPAYIGDFFGDLIETFNINLSRNQGKISLSDKLFPHTVTADIGGGIGLPTTFLYTDFNSGNGTKSFFAGCDKVFLATAYTSNFAADSLTSSPTGMSDSESVIHGKTNNNADIVVLHKGLGNTDLYRFNRDVSTSTWATNWWTSTLAQPALSGTTPVLLKVFGNAPALFILNGNALHSVGTPGTSSTPAASTDVTYNRLVFKAGYQGNWIAATSEKIYIGLKDSRGDTYPSFVEEYDPFSETVREIKVQQGATIGFLSENILNIIDIKGNLKSYTGNGFQTYASMPTAFIDGAIIRLPHRNGIAIVDDKICFNMPACSGINPLVITDFLYHGGVWIYDREFKRLYHSASPVTSRANIQDVGCSQIVSGALFDIGNAADTTQKSGYYFAGMQAEVTAGGGFTQGIFSNVVLGGGTSAYAANWGHFKTAKIKSSEIQTNWRNVLVKYTGREFPSGAGTGTIIVKYRTIDTPNQYGIIAGNITNSTGTWTATTSTAAFLTIHGTAVLNVAVGDEMFVWQGRGAGVSAEVSAINITGSTANLTVLINNSEIDLSSKGAFICSFENWTTLSPSITDNGLASALIDLPEAQSEWVQFKVIMKTGFNIDEMQVGFEPSLKVEEEQPHRDNY